jgi:autotransporter-associated beta strand protein
VSYEDSAIDIGSIEGDGIVYLGKTAISVGATDLSTAFSGPIHNRGIADGRGGSLSKVGAGTLTISGSSDYADGTTISEGFLRVDNSRGSGTGTGPVQINGGTLGGRGIISGNVTVGTGTGSGAFIAPGSGNTTLTIQSALTFKSDGTYSWRVQPGGKSDKLVANEVAIESGAQITGRGRGTLTVGTVFTAISNTSATPISGSFANLSDGGTIKIGNNTFQANYEGGDGNDLTLTVVSARP